MIDESGRLRDPVITHPEPARTEVHGGPARRGRILFRTVPGTQEPLRWRDSAGMLLLFLVLVLVWCAGLTSLEAAAGLPLAVGGGLSSRGNYLDALWHLLTAVAIALPLRNRRLLVMLPLLSLGLDIDHVFGAYIPAPFPREAHDLVFLAIATLALFLLAGRFLAGASSAGWVLHVSVDGGAFPLIAPFVAAPYALTYPVVVLGIVAAEAAAFLSVRSLASTRQPRELILPGTAVLALAMIVYWVAPGFAGFTGA